MSFSRGVPTMSLSLERGFREWTTVRRGLLCYLLGWLKLFESLVVEGWAQCYAASLAPSEFGHHINLQHPSNFPVFPSPQNPPPHPTSFPLKTIKAFRMEGSASGRPPRLGPVPTPSTDSNSAAPSWRDHVPLA